jgi:hypothetical protein
MRQTMVRRCRLTHARAEGIDVSPRYAIRLSGSLDDAARDAFGDLDLVVDEQGRIVVTGEFDQAALHGLLERARVLGLTVVDVRRVRGQPRRQV